MLSFAQKALNLFNAALVTPTYYVFFTSATIVTSAVLFQGFKGTPLQIVTVIMGFLQICSGVVLLQLSKSAKDVPDSAVFKGDLDQVRTVAEMEEPEYEPRADTLRGGAAILRSLSKARSHKELAEAKKIQEEHMEPIGEGEQVEFDGLRRRKTVLDPSRPPTRSATVVRTIHPPLGMSQFPTDDSDDDNDSFHPGFFQRLRSRGKSTSSRGSSHAPGTSGMGMQTLPSIPQADGASDRESDAGSYKQTMMTQDTSYKPIDTHIHFASLPDPPRHGHGRQDSSDSLAPPRPPAHIAKRQFSFQNVFSRNRPDSTGEASSSKRPTSRHSRKSSREGKASTTATEEERLGLVKGDSTNLLPIASRGSDELVGPPVYSDDWDMPRTSSPGYSPERPRVMPPPIRRVDTDMSELSPRDPKEFEKGPGNPNTFL
jgi:hypothetical protein